MDYYKILGIDKNSSEEEITRAFRILAKKCHPDLNNSCNAKQEFIEVFEAYSILRDPSKRKIYDSIVWDTIEPEENESQEKTEYNSWKQQADKDGAYYSSKEFKVFDKEFLKKLREVGKFTQRVMFYFGLLIATGLFSTFIIKPIFLMSFEKALSTSYQETRSPNESGISTNNRIIESSTNSISLPLPLSSPLRNWERIYIDNIGSIDIPPTMEVQSGLYKKIVDPLKPTVMKSMGALSNANFDLIMQQKGLNDLDKGGFQKYARVMINTDIGNKGDFDNLGFDISKYSESDIRELDKVFNSAIIQSIKGTTIKLVQWFPLKIETISGMSCIHISYMRQLSSNPIVQVDLYKFQDIDKMYTLTLSYRKNEKEYWNEYFPTILSSFRIDSHY